jgi:CRP-like cAMP-binding protein
MELYAYLSQFHPITSADYALLEGAFKARNFKKGDLITAAGQVQKELYFVKSGVQMSYFLAEEKTHVVAFTYAPGICAVPESFSTQKPSACYLTCLSDSELYYITYNDLQLLFDKSQPLERLFRKMTEIILAGVINRHIELQALSIEERYKAFCKRSPHLLQLVPHKYVASYLGINATNFSKLFNSVKI